MKRQNLPRKITIPVKENKTISRLTIKRSNNFNMQPEHYISSFYTYQKMERLKVFHFFIYFCYHSTYLLMIVAYE